LRNNRPILIVEVGRFFRTIEDEHGCY
jgi:hypothetical protein